MTTQSPIPVTPPNPVDAAAPAPPEEEVAGSIFDSTGTEHLEAFEATRAERDALAPEALIPIYADIHTAASRVLGATLRTADYEDELSALPGFAGIRARAQRIAKAASQAQTNYLNTFSPPEGFVEMIEDLKLKRERYLHEARGLVWREILVDQQLEGLNKSVGYRVVVYDVMRLCSLFRDVMPRLAGKSFVTEAEVTSVYALAARAEKMLELREDKARARVEANDTRQRAFTLLAKVYDQLRRALTFIVWDSQKLDAIAPSMQVNMRRPKPEEDEPDAVAPAAPAPPAASASSAASPGASPAGATTPVAQGLPGASPFTTG